MHTTPKENDKMRIELLPIKMIKIMFSKTQTKKKNYRCSLSNYELIYIG
jgi:hypothetical protein